jgi:predicted secreted hydrolase
MTFHRAYLGDPDWKWSFPEAFQPQLDFKTEWWWWGGHCYDKDRRFSFHAVLFRFGTVMDGVLMKYPDGSVDTQPIESRWIAQWGITDHADNSYHTGEMLLPADFVFPAEPTALQLGNAESALSLKFELGNPVLQGERGVTQKGPAVGDASYHFACPQSRCKGLLRLGNEVFTVRGSTWVDVERGSDMFGAGKAGSWQWCCLLLNDGRRLSNYRLYDAPNAGGTIHPELEIAGERFRLEPLLYEEFPTKLTAPYQELPCRVWKDGKICGLGFLERASSVTI